MAENNPATTYTLEEFVDMQSQDELTYANFSIINYDPTVQFAQDCVLDYYLAELKALCLKVNGFTTEQISKYKYCPDLLAYDVYGSVQLDFVVLKCNGIIDPKEFDFKRGYLLLPKSTVLKEFLSMVYNAEKDWIDLNRKTLQTMYET